jgi:hypothetical protein
MALARALCPAYITAIWSQVRATMPMAPQRIRAATTVPF